jgi:hypothetical protein
MNDFIRQTSSPMVLLPAYGRKYTSAAKALKDWEAGKDFKIKNGPYTSVRDAERLANVSSSVWIQHSVDDTVRVL